MSYRLAVAELRTVVADLRRRVNEVTLSRPRRWYVGALEVFAYVQLLLLLVYVRLPENSPWEDPILVIALVSILVLPLFVALNWHLIRTLYRQRRLYRALGLLEPDVWLSPEGRSSLPRWGTLLLGIAQVALLGWVVSVLNDEASSALLSGDNPALWLFALLLLVSSFALLFGWEIPARGLELLAVALTISLPVVWVLVVVFTDDPSIEPLFTLLLVLPACLVTVVDRYLARTRRRFAPFRSARKFSEDLEKLLEKAEADGLAKVEVDAPSGIQLAGWERWLARSDRVEALNRASKGPLPLSYAISTRAADRLSALDMPARLAIMDHVRSLVADRSAGPRTQGEGAGIERSRVPETAWSLEFQEIQRPRHLEIRDVIQEGAERP